ncbi:39674_t:CDS:2, partial [Gigaspora margarita]
MVSSITYSNLSQKIIDCELPSSETLNTLSTSQQIEILKLCYNAQRKLLNQLLEEKRIENADIEIPTIQLPKRNKTQSSKLKLSALCSWSPKDYFAKIKADFTPHLEENKIKASVTWSQLGYTARESWIEDVYNKHRSKIGSNKWIVQECLKQKLTDRADNFRRKNYKAKPRITQNLDNNDELEMSIQQNIEKITNANKENMSIDFEKEFCESDGDNLEDEDCSGSSFSTYATPTLNNYVTLDSDEYIDPTSSGHIVSNSNSDSEEADEGYMTQTSKKDTQLPLQSQKIQNVKISNKT